MTGSSKNADGWGVLALVGLYGDNGRHRLEALTQSFAEGGRVGTIVDLTELTHLDAPVISWLLRLKVQLDSQGHQVRLAGVSPKHLRVLELRGLDKTFAVYPDVDSARPS